MKIHAIRTGDVQIKSRQVQPRGESQAARILGLLTDREWTEWLPIACYAIDHPEGLIVVDTGETSRTSEPGYAPRWHPVMATCNRFNVSPEQEVGPQLQALGIEPADVKRVVMTHMHTDHAGGLAHFPHAEILMSATEAKAATARSGQLQGYLTHRYPEWLEPKTLVFEDDPWEGFDASIRLTDDGAVRAIPTPGHTNGHISVVVDQGDHLVLLAGDATYAESAMLRGLIDGVAASAKLHRDTNRRLRALCAGRRVVVVPAHDPDGPRRLAGSVLTAV